MTVALQANHPDIRTDANDAPFPTAAGVNPAHTVDGVHSYLKGLRLCAEVTFSGFHLRREQRPR